MQRSEGMILGGGEGGAAGRGSSMLSDQRDVV